MSQHDFDIANQTAPAFRADLNLALKGLYTLSSGPTEPNGSINDSGGMMWNDTTTNTLKIRTDADDAWISIGTLDQTTNLFTAANGVTVTGVQTLLNKTLNAPVINNPTGDVVTITGTQTLTNKTLTSPSLTGVPTAPTAAVGTDTTQVATTEFVKANGWSTGAASEIYIAAGIDPMWSVAVPAGVQEIVLSYQNLQTSAATGGKVYCGLGTGGAVAGDTSGYLWYDNGQNESENDSNGLVILRGNSDLQPIASGHIRFIRTSPSSSDFMFQLVGQWIGRSIVAPDDDQMVTNFGTIHGIVGEVDYLFVGSDTTSSNFGLNVDQVPAIQVRFGY